jgi:hypothetical protein
VVFHRYSLLYLFLLRTADFRAMPISIPRPWSTVRRPPHPIPDFAILHHELQIHKPVYWSWLQKRDLTL